MDAERTLLGRRRKAIERERRAKAGMAKGGKIKKKAGVAKGGKIKKMARGGTCRGMGAATKGGNYRAR